MVPDDTGDVDLAVQVLVAFVLIQTVLERLADGDPMVMGSWSFKVAVLYTIMAHMFWWRNSNNTCVTTPLTSQT
jgi:hypothetical protein